MSDNIFSTGRTKLKQMLYHKIRLKYYIGSVSNTDFDDAQIFTQSGTDVWTSGLVMPIKGIEGSHEAVLLQQGKIKTNDKQIFVAGDENLTSPAGGAIKIGVGSPVVNEHSIIPDGIIAYPDTGEMVYKKIYCRTLSAGSFIGE